MSGAVDVYFLGNNLNQAKIARECASWLKNNVEVKVMVDAPPGLSVCISQSKKSESVTIQRNSEFTAEGLGFVSPPALHMSTSTTETEGYIK